MTVRLAVRWEPPAVDGGEHSALPRARCASVRAVYALCCEAIPRALSAAYTNAFREVREERLRDERTRGNDDDDDECSDDDGDECYDDDECRCGEYGCERCHSMSDVTPYDQRPPAL